MQRIEGRLRLLLVKPKIHVEKNGKNCCKYGYTSL